MRNFIARKITKYNDLFAESFSILKSQPFMNYREQKKSYSHSYQDQNM